MATKRSSDKAVLCRHWGKLLYHCTVWQANYIGDAIRTLIAFSMNFSYTQTVIKYETDLSKGCLFGQVCVSNRSTKVQITLPDWLKTTEVARNGGMYLKKTNKPASDVLCEVFVSFNTFSFLKWVISQWSKSLSLI